MIDHLCSVSRPTDKQEAKKQVDSTDLHLTPPPSLESILCFQHHFRLSISAAGCVYGRVCVCKWTMSETVEMKPISCSETAHKKKNSAKTGIIKKTACTERHVGTELFLADSLKHLIVALYAPVSIFDTSQFSTTLDYNLFTDPLVC